MSSTIQQALEIYKREVKFYKYHIDRLKISYGLGIGNFLTKAPKQTIEDAKERTAKLNAMAQVLGLSLEEKQEILKEFDFTMTNFNILGLY